MKTISSTELKSWIDSNKDFQLIDVRESDELEICSLSKANHIALGTIPENLDAIATDKPVVFMCRSGKRSSNGLFFAQEQIPNGDFYNLDGGILGWISTVDNSMTPY
jgi:rhodanese-related sulfurtransferase